MDKLATVTRRDGIVFRGYPSSIEEYVARDSNGQVVAKASFNAGGPGGGHAADLARNRIAKKLQKLGYTTN